MDVKVETKHLPISPQKLRLVCDQVRGMGADQALTVLKFMPQKGAEFIDKSVASAVANAVNNFDLSRDTLYVKLIFADDGPSLKRMRAGARGRYKPQIKRTSHLTVVLAEREES